MQIDKLKSKRVAKVFNVNAHHQQAIIPEIARSWFLCGSVTIPRLSMKLQRNHFEGLVLADRVNLFHISGMILIYYRPPSAYDYRNASLYISLLYAICKLFSFIDKILKGNIKMKQLLFALEAVCVW